MKSKIKIKKSKVGTFTKAAKAHGKTVSEFENQVLSHPENYSKAMRKKAQFSKNAKKWKHEDGGEIDMFPNGGTTNPPIYVTDPNDPRLQAYQDSLDLYNDYLYGTEDLRKRMQSKVDNHNKNIQWYSFEEPWKVEKVSSLNSDNFGNGNNIRFIPEIFSHLKIKPIGVENYRAVDSKYTRDSSNSTDVRIFQKPVQPVIYRPSYLGVGAIPSKSYVTNSLGEKFPEFYVSEPNIKIESSKPSLFTTTMPTEINPIPFKEGTYFTREQQGQETGGKEYFDKKTGKKLGKFPFGGLSVAPLFGKKNQDAIGGNNHMTPRDVGMDDILGAPHINDPDKMIQEMMYESSPQAKQDWMNKATPLQKSLSGLANPVGAEMLSGAFMKNGGKIKKKLKKYGDAGTVDIQPNDYWNYEGFSPQALPQTEQPYNLQIADYQSGYENAPIPENGFSSINLTEDQKRNMLSDKQKRKGFKPNIDQNIMTSDPYLNRVMQGLNSNNPVGFAKAGIAGAAGISNLVGNIKKNKFTRGQENNLLFNQIDGALYNPYNYDYNDYRFGQNRNQAFFEDGGISDYKSNNNGILPTAEVEGGETINLPNGLSEMVNGKSHAEGGIDMSLPQNTKVFSEKLKFKFNNGKKKSFSKEANRFSTKDDFEMLENNKAAELSKSTAELNIKLKNQKLDELFNLQEGLKLEGHFGSDVKKEAMKDYKKKFGGSIKMKKYDDGGENWKQSVFNTPYGRLTPTGVDLNSSPLLDWGQVRDIWQPYSEDKITSFLQLQELMYDYTLDKAEKGDKSALKQLGNMWKTYGITNKNEKSYQKYQDKINKGNLSLQDYKDLRGSFLDNLKGKRALLPMSDSAKSGLSNIKDSDLIGDNPIQNNAKFQNYTDGKKKLPKATFLATPRSYTEDPLFTSQVSPETINPRYLNINSQLNDINRVQSAINKNKSGISSVDRSNIFQGQINAYNQLQNLFDQKYNYDRQQDSNVEQFNAQSRANTKLQNLGERNRFMDLIQRRRGILDTQMRTDINADIQNSMLANQYNLTSDYLQGALHPTTSYTFGADVVNSYGDYEKLKEMADKAKAADKLYGKFGGKIKLKNKKSSK